jgi:iron complex transport system substrate-binding protein
VARVPDRRRLGWCLCVGLLVASGARAEIEVADDAGRQLRLPAPARRIVSLAPHATELLFAIGAGRQVVGVSALSDYPEAARRLPQVSGSMRLDLERVLALKPDLAIGWRSGNAPADLERLAALGIPVFIAEPRRLDDLPDTMLRLGRAVGREAPAQRAAEEFRAGLARLRAEYRARRPVRVFLTISTQPLMTLNRAHLADDALTLCGGRNVFAGAALIAPPVSVESVLLADPQAILYSDALGTPEVLRAWWQGQADLPAVRAGRLYALPGALLRCLGPRVLHGARVL